ESIEYIGTQLQAKTLIEFNVFSHGQIQLISRHGAGNITAHGAGKWIAAAQCIHRKRVVYDEVNIRWVDKGTGSGARTNGSCGSGGAVAHVNHLRRVDIT